MSNLNISSLSKENLQQGSTIIRELSHRITRLLPIKNGMPYLIQTLKFIKDPTCKNYEVLIWDNGSTDGTLEEITMLVPARVPRRTVFDCPLPLGLRLAEMI